jgi:hypothetical protein
MSGTALEAARRGPARDRTQRTPRASSACEPARSAARPQAPGKRRVGYGEGASRGPPRCLPPAGSTRRGGLAAGTRRSKPGATRRGSVRELSDTSRVSHSRPTEPRPETPVFDAAPVSREGASQALSNPRDDNHGPLYGNHRPLLSRRPKARIAVVKGAAFSRACSSVIDAASSRWPISHIRRASTATITMTTNPIRSSSTATVGPCSSSDQASPHSYCGHR